MAPETRKQKFSTYYTEQSSINKSGDNVKLWVLRDYNAPQLMSKGSFNLATDMNHLSLKAKLEYNCKTEESRKIFISWHTGNMGGGEKITSNSELGGWNPVVPDSIDQVMWTLACSK